MTRSWNSSDSSLRHVSLPGQALITCFYLLGVGGNVCALALLAKARAGANEKHALMLRCLSVGDLLALLGSFALMYARLYLDPRRVATSVFCALRVLLRTFGLWSGCVAAVMAVERYLALARPFLYHKHITYKVIKRVILATWMVALALVCLPLMGFGLYYDGQATDGRPVCVRYRFARSAKDVAYAYLMLGFGLSLCLIMAGCNLAVVKVLCRIGAKKWQAGAGRTVVRKESNELAFDHVTAEEVAFAKLMIVFCIFFVVCWLPQMVTIVMAQADPEGEERPFYRVADVLLATNFSLDPIVYVLSRRAHREGLKRMLRPVCQFCRFRRPDAPSSIPDAV
ncbi:prostaglandin E2 receptor EP2 subtype-like [Centruroides vittatus]|uniref:prostaglandin E2 receptor EP2 subtype-like n=1 Tax=Centruroides vittatus TaxID=120091 RepID=UPI00350FE707